MKQLVAPLLAVLLLGAASASAQTTFRLGLRGGANRALTTLADASNSASFTTQFSADKSVILAWQAGLVVEANFGKLALQPALSFSQKGEKFTTTSTISGTFWTTGSETTTTARYNWLELPMNVVYTLHGDHGWQFFAGPYVALAVGGRKRGTTSYHGGAFYDPLPAADFDAPITYKYSNRRFDAGVNFGIGYRQGPLQVQLGYGLGLRNLHEPVDGIIVEYPQYYHDFDGDAAYNRVAQLTGTYFISL